VRLPWTKRLWRRWTLDRALMKLELDQLLGVEDADVATVDLVQPFRCPARAARAWSTPASAKGATRSSPCGSARDGERLAAGAVLDRLAAQQVADRALLPRCAASRLDYDLRQPTHRCGKPNGSGQSRMVGARHQQTFVESGAPGRSRLTAGLQLSRSLPFNDQGDRRAGTVVWKKKAYLGSSVRSQGWRSISTAW